MVCPKCYAAYRPGFTTCSDCKVPLVDADLYEWDDELTEEIALADEKREVAKKFMRYGLIALAAVVVLIVATVKWGSDAASGPGVIALITMAICFNISAYRYAESKGYNGLVGVGCLILGALGLTILFNLRDKIRLSAPR